MSVRLTRASVQVAIQIPKRVRITRVSVQVAVGSLPDPVIRGIRRAGVIHHRQPNETPRA